MSDLDYEDEVNETTLEGAVVGQRSPTESFQDHPNNAECSEISQHVQENSEEGEVESDAGEDNNAECSEISQVAKENSEEGEVESDAGEVSRSDRDLTDLEEGEINEENVDCPNSVVCRFFQSGNCRFGKQCRFMHVGASAYKMFESRIPSKNFHPAIPHQYTYYAQSKLSPPPVYSERNGDSAWEQGLEEARKLLLIARDKKETDVEFEDKKLYLQMEEETESKTRKRDLKKKERHSKSKTNSELISSEFSEKETKMKKRKNHSKSSKLSPEIWIDPWRRSRSRTRKRSRSSSTSSLSSRHGTRSSSLCSLCSSDAQEQRSDCKVHTSKSESKLQRVFSRTFSRSRSRKRSLSRSRSDSRSASLKRSLYRSYSRSRSSSSSASWCSKKSSIQRAFAKSISNRPSSNASKISHSPKQHKRKLSPESNTSKRWPKETASSEWDSSSSDLTVSSITCTSFSGTRSSVESDSVKRAKVTINPNTYGKKLVHSDETLPQSYDKSRKERDSTYKKCQNEKRATVKPKSSNDKPIPDETASRKSHTEKDTPVSNNKLDGTPLVQNLEKKDISELELLKYLPTKNRRPAVERKEDTSSKSTETNIEPKKVISISLKPKTKFVPTKSVLSSPVRESPPKVVNKPLSRREQLLRQLKAVELAIAKKKRIS